MSDPKSNRASVKGDRLHGLDGVRGILAVVVLGQHVASPLGVYWFSYPAKLAVCGFFLLSGFVLTRSWEGRLVPFLARRFVRLWPVYAFCLGSGYAIAGVHPVWSQFLWYPLITADALPHIDPPTWSLMCEAWAMPLMPLIVWAGSGAVLRAAIAMSAFLLLSHLFVGEASGQFLIAMSLFCLGAFLSRFEFRNRLLESAVPQWLGRISYSLYLTNWLVFAVARRFFGPERAIFAIPLTFLVAWIVWKILEAPSIHASRRVGRWFAQATAPPPRPLAANEAELSL